MTISANEMGRLIRRRLREALGQKIAKDNGQCLERYQKWCDQFSKQLLETKSIPEFRKLLDSQNKNGSHFLDVNLVNSIINTLSIKVNNTDDVVYLLSIHNLLVSCQYNFNAHFINTESGLLLEENIFSKLEQPLLFKLEKLSTIYEIRKFVDSCPVRFFIIKNVGVKKLIATCYSELSVIKTFSEGNAILEIIAAYSGLENNHEDYYKIIDIIAPFAEKIEEIHYILNKCRLNKEYLRERIIVQLTSDVSKFKNIEMAYNLCKEEDDFKMRIFEMLNNFHQKTA